MAGGIYSALSGLQARSARLDRLAADIANAGTSGYKAERGTNLSVERATFSDMLDSAVDVVAAPTHVDFSAGATAPTGRDLDMAIEGTGFFAVQTADGVRYTRNGHFTRSVNGTLTTQDGGAVLGENGPITLPAGQVAIASDGTITVEDAVVGKARVVAFSDPSRLVREDGVKFRAPSDMTSVAATNYTVEAGTLEQSNVSLPDRMAQLTELSRNFDALQRGLSVLLNEIDGKAITELGRR